MLLIAEKFKFKDLHGMVFTLIF